MRAQNHVILEKRMAESEQKPMSKAITGGQQPVHNEAGDLVPGGAPPADVVSAPGISSSPQVKSSTMKRALPDSSALHGNAIASAVV